MPIYNEPSNYIARQIDIINNVEERLKHDWWLVYNKKTSIIEINIKRWRRQHNKTFSLTIVVFNLCIFTYIYVYISIYHKKYNSRILSLTLDQHCTNFIQMFCVYWVKCGTLVLQFVLPFSRHLVPRHIYRYNITCIDKLKSTRIL